MLHVTHHEAVSIRYPYDDAYYFLAQPLNFVHWAAGLGAGLEQLNGEWVARTPSGPAKVRFSPVNAFGVLDHDVALADGTEVHVPLRVIRNGDGIEVILTIMRTPHASDAAFDADLAAVRRDLQTLKHLLEARRVESQ